MGVITDHGFRRRMQEEAPKDTRKAAFNDAKRRRRELKERCLAALTGAALTADEVATQIGEEVLSIRPRITELFREGHVVKTVLRRPNKSGKKAIVWTAKDG